MNENPEDKGLSYLTKNPSVVATDGARLNELFRERVTTKGWFK